MGEGEGEGREGEGEGEGEGERERERERERDKKKNKSKQDRGKQKATDLFAREFPGRSRSRQYFFVGSTVYSVWRVCSLRRSNPSTVWATPIHRMVNQRWLTELG